MVKENYPLEIATILLDQLKTIDPLYVGSLGIKVKSYCLDGDKENVEINFNASSLTVDGKRFKNMNYITVGYNIPTDYYWVLGAHFDKNYNRFETTKYTDLDPNQVYEAIHELVSF